MASFATAPLIVACDNAYILLVTGPLLVSASPSFEWIFTENGDIANVQVTECGESIYRPGTLGTVSVGVRILGAGDVEHAALSLDQEIVPRSAEIEAMFTEEQNKPGPALPGRTS